MVARADADRYHAAMHPLAVQTGREIAERRLFDAGETLVVAASGGNDSMVLLDLLHHLAPQLGVHLVVAHLNHGLRKPASDRDARFVERQAARLDMPCIIERADVSRLRRSERLSVEMAARKLRHEFLARTAQAAGARTVVLGHHQDDQVELFFLRLLRGAGGSGLAGMQWTSPSPADRAVRLVRPLLGQTRETLAAYARDRNVRSRRDASNRGLEPLRNRIRHRLLPCLRREYQAAVNETVCRTMDIVGAEADLADQAAARWLEKPHRTPFDRLHVAVQRAILRRQLWGQGTQAEFGLVEELRQTAGRPVTVRPGLILVREATGRLRESQPHSVGFGQAAIEIELKGRAGECRFAGVQIRWQRVAGPGLRGLGAGRPGLERFDAAKVGERVILRHWRPGDRFQPIGMPAPVKLQDLFVNAQIDRQRRHGLVVATTLAGNLFWVEGLRMAEGFRLDKRSRQRLKWQWHRSGQGGQRLVAPEATP